jgi:hypothetical protein
MHVWKLPTHAHKHAVRAFVRHTHARTHVQCVWVRMCAPPRSRCAMYERVCVHAPVCVRTRTRVRVTPRLGRWSASRARTHVRVRACACARTCFSEIAHAGLALPLRADEGSASYASCHRSDCRSARPPAAVATACVRERAETPGRKTVSSQLATLRPRRALRAGPSAGFGTAAAAALAPPSMLTTADRLSSARRDSSALTPRMESRMRFEYTSNCADAEHVMR